YIIDVLKMLLGSNIKYNLEPEYLLLESQGDLDGLSDTIQSLESDLNALIHFYQTETDQPEKEISLILESFLKMSYGHYQFKSLLLNIKGKAEATELFNFIVEGTGITDEIILAMADCNLNVSQASQMLYMHRNTLLYKIERLISLKGFDLKNFNDLYILVQLLRA
ncbi:MAG: helix-turn-helix domain-containing protein, partial [Anaeroplasmataceae bacterium]|nr:helix-turn-helix domain-containing protein [Anaeroplasmataceae bacterium]